MTLNLIKPAATLAVLSLVAACGSSSTVTYQTASSGCTNQASGYATSNEGLPMRCGPQEQSPWAR